MSLDLILAFVAGIIMLVFTAYVLQRYVMRRRPNFLYWGLGLGMFGLSSLAGAYLSLRWNPGVFFVWYYFGAVLTAAWIGHGTVYLLVSRRWARLLTIFLLAGTLVALALLLNIMGDLDASAYQAGVPMDAQYKEIMPAISDGAIVRLATPFFNVYGLVTLVGGAIYSTFLYWRKRVLPYRVIGNILIAVGGLVVASASTLARFDIATLHSLGQLLAAVLMFAGFLVSARPAAVPAEAFTATSVGD